MGAGAGQKQRQRETERDRESDLAVRERTVLVKRANADVNRRMKKDGDTALMIAIKFARGTSAHIPILLASKGIDLEVRNKAGQTALMVAVGMGRHDIVNQLLLAGAEASAVIKSSYTAESSVSLCCHSSHSQSTQRNF